MTIIAAIAVRKQFLLEFDALFLGCGASGVFAAIRALFWVGVANENEATSITHKNHRDTTIIRIWKRRLIPRRAA